MGSAGRQLAGQARAEIVAVNVAAASHSADRARDVVFLKPR
jgi:hypothetical protein